MVLRVSGLRKVCTNSVTESTYLRYQVCLMDEQMSLATPAPGPTFHLKGDAKAFDLYT